MLQVDLHLVVGAGGCRVGIFGWGYGVLPVLCSLHAEGILIQFAFLVAVVAAIAVIVTDHVWFGGGVVATDVSRVYVSFVRRVSVDVSYVVTVLSCSWCG